jgi:hypothetical protein
MLERCMELPPVWNGDSLIVWKLKPHEIIHTEQANPEQPKQHKEPQGASEADAAGMWHVPMNITGKACTAAR